MRTDLDLIAEAIAQADSTLNPQTGTPTYSDELIVAAQRMYKILKHKTLPDADVPAFILGVQRGQLYTRTREYQLNAARMSLAEKNGTLANVLIELQVPAIEPQALAREGFMVGIAAGKVRTAESEAAEPPETLPKVGDYILFCGHLDGLGIGICRCEARSFKTPDGTKHTARFAAQCDKCYLAGVSPNTAAEVVTLTEEMLQYVISR